MVLDDVLSDITDIIKDDSNLLSQVNIIKEILEEFQDKADDNLKQKLKALNSYITEAFKLDRRILRNRRENVQGLTVDRKLNQFIDIDFNETEVLFEKIENIRIKLSTSINKHENYKNYESLSKWFFTLLELIQKRLFNEEDVDTLFENEVLKKSGVYPDAMEIKDYIKNLIFINLIDTPSLKIVKQIIEKQNNAKKLYIIFCSSNFVAKSIFSYLEIEMKKLKLIHSSDIRGYFNQHDFDVIICDQKSEEGLNLQGNNRVIIHFDIPYNPNRVEQRIGRVDRFGSKEFESFVLFDASNPYEKFWKDFFEQSLKTFERSTASLQFVIDTEMSKLSENLFDQGYEYFFNLIEGFGGDKGIISKELKKIKQQEDLDTFNDQDNVFYNALVEEDENWRDYKKYLFEWLIKVLMLDTNDKSTNLIVNLKNSNFKGKQIIKQNEFVNFYIEKPGLLKWTADKTSMKYAYQFLEENKILGSPVFGNRLNFFDILKNENVDIVFCSNKTITEENLDSFHNLLNKIDGSDSIRFSLNKNKCLIPLNNYLYNLKNTIDMDYTKQQMNQRDMTVYSNEYIFHRQTLLNNISSKRGNRVLRHGDDFINGIDQITSLDDRGISSAIYRYINPNKYKLSKNIELYFCFNYLNEINFRDFNNENSYDLPSFIRKGDFFYEVEYKTIWLDEEFNEVKNISVLEILNTDFRSLSQELMKDTNLNSLKWDMLNILEYSGQNNWNEYTESANDFAIKIIKNSKKFKEKTNNSIRFLEDFYLDRFSQLNARISNTYDSSQKLKEENDLELEKKIYQILKKGMLNTSFKLESAEVIFLSNDIFFD